MPCLCVATTVGDSIIRHVARLCEEHEENCRNQAKPPTNFTDSENDPLQEVDGEGCFTHLMSTSLVVSSSHGGACHDTTWLGVVMPTIR